MSTEVKSKEKVNMDPQYIIKLTVTLFVTCVVVAGALGLVNSVTAGPIAQINKEKTEAAMKMVVADPDNSEFSEALELTEEMTAAATAGGGSVTEAYAVTVNGESDGYALKIVASGSQGNIEMMVGVDGEGTVTGASIVGEPLASGVPVLDQFQGKTAADMPLTVGSNVDAISGATVSTKGVTAGVNAALAVAAVMG